MDTKDGQKSELWKLLQLPFPEFKEKFEGLSAQEKIEILHPAGRTTYRALIFCTESDGPQWQEYFRYLLHKGADVTVMDKDKRTVLQKAIIAGFDQVIIDEIVQEVSVFKKTSLPEYINHQDMKGKTALHHACDKDRPSAITKLLAKDADRNVKDHNGKTAEELLSDNCRFMGLFPQLPGDEDDDIFDSPISPTIPEEVFANLAQQLSEEWKLLGRHLDLSDAELEEIEYENHVNFMEAIHKMLQVWNRKMEGEEEARALHMLTRAAQNTQRSDLIPMIYTKQKPKSGLVSDGLLSELAHYLSYDWRRLGTCLGFTIDQLHRLQINRQGKVPAITQEFLRIWQNRNLGIDGDLRSLLKNALIKAGMPRLIAVLYPTETSDESFLNNAADYVAILRNLSVLLQAEIEPNDIIKYFRRQNGRVKSSYLRLKPLQAKLEALHKAIGPTSTNVTQYPLPFSNEDMKTWLILLLFFKEDNTEWVYIFMKFLQESHIHLFRLIEAERQTKEFEARSKKGVELLAKLGQSPPPLKLENKENTILKTPRRQRKISVPVLPPINNTACSVCKPKRKVSVPGNMGYN